MANSVTERYTPKVVGVDSTITLSDDAVGGFLCKTAGTLTIVNSAGTTIVDALPVSASTYYPTPFYLGGPGGTVTTAGGASGTLATG